MSAHERHTRAAPLGIWPRHAAEKWRSRPCTVRTVPLVCGDFIQQGEGRGVVVRAGGRDGDRAPHVRRDLLAVSAWLRIQCMVALCYRRQPDRAAHGRTAAFGCGAVIEELNLLVDGHRDADEDGGDLLRRARWH